MTIELNDLWRVYQVGDQPIEAVRGVSLRIDTGEFVSIVGHSGSGKSTLLSMIGGLAKPSRGSVVIDGVDLWSRDDDYRCVVRNKKIGFVFQFASLIPTLTAIDNVVLPYMFNGAGVGSPAYQHAQQLLERVGLAEKVDAFPNELSGGQQRRVAIARALVNRPVIILADEPTGDLDEQTEAEVMDMLLKSAREYRAAFLMVTHNRAIAQSADRMLQLRNGGLA
jgi:putative ABC transport system ATP-binding protein/lipoprotein-releasing system ATP-binding protein